MVLLPHDAAVVADPAGGDFPRNGRLAGGELGGGVPPGSAVVFPLGVRWSVGPRLLCDCLLLLLSLLLLEEEEVEEVVGCYCYCGDGGFGSR